MNLFKHEYVVFGSPFLRWSFSKVSVLAWWWRRAIKFPLSSSSLCPLNGRFCSPQNTMASIIRTTIDLFLSTISLYFVSRTLSILFDSPDWIARKLLAAVLAPSWLWWASWSLKIRGALEKLIKGVFTRTFPRGSLPTKSEHGAEKCPFSFFECLNHGYVVNHDTCAFRALLPLHLKMKQTKYIKDHIKCNLFRRKGI